MKKICLLAILLSIFFASKVTWAQKNTDEPYYEYFKSFLKLKNDRGALSSETYHDFVISYPTEKSVKYMSSYTLYLSSDEEILDYQVTLITPKGKEKDMKGLKVTLSENDGDEYFVTGTKVIRLNFSGLEKDVKVHIRYGVRTEDLHYFQPFLMKQLLDSRKNEFKVYVPKDIQLRLLKKNFSDHKIDIQREKEKNGQFITYTGLNKEKVETESDGPSILYYTPHVLPILEKYGDGEEIKNYLSNVDDLYRYYHTIVYKKGFKTNDELEQVAKQIKEESENEDDIIKNTYRWVQRNVRYIAYEEGSDGVIPRAPALVCARKFGDCKDMSNLLRKLLSLNGIESHLSWIGTRSLPYSYEEVYTMNADNHMITSLKRNGQWLYLDATDPNGIYGLPTSHIQDKECLIAQDDDHYALVHIPVVNADVSGVNYDIELKIEDKSLAIDVDMACNGYSAGKLRNLLLYSREEKKEDLVKGFININSNKTKVENYEFEDVNDMEVDVQANYTLDGRVRYIEDIIYINPFINQVLPFGTIESEDRELDVEISYNQSFKNNIRLNIPDGYQVESTLEKINIKKDLYQYSFWTENGDGAIIMHEEVGVQTPDLFIPVSQFDDWNDLVRQVKKLYKTSIKLTKI